MAHRKYKDWTNRIKLAMGCELCGYKGSPVALDFHHRDESLKEFSIGNHPVPRARLMIEVIKCAVLCSNCHRRVHAGEVTL